MALHVLEHVTTHHSANTLPAKHQNKVVSKDIILTIKLTQKTHLSYNPKPTYDANNADGAAVEHEETQQGVGNVALESYPRMATVGHPHTRVSLPVTEKIKREIGADIFSNPFSFKHYIEKAH